jgi:hypothetical protein
MIAQSVNSNGKSQLSEEAGRMAILSVCRPPVDSKSVVRWHFAMIIYPWQPVTHMSTEPASAGGSKHGCEVMAAEDGEQFVIAEICCDNAWVSARREGAIQLAAWR